MPTTLPVATLVSETVTPGGLAMPVKVGWWLLVMPSPGMPVSEAGASATVGMVGSDCWLVLTVMIVWLVALEVPAAETCVAV